MATRNRSRIGLLLIAAGLVLIAIPASAQQLAKRLILKDGSYQLATKWEVKGDRVRYLSAERDEWEELPNCLVDWAATHKFEKDRAAGVPAPEAVALDKEFEAERRAEEAKTPEVAPGLHLPEDGGMLLLDTFQTQPQLVLLQQNSGEINRNRTKNMLRAAIIPIPIVGSKQTIELGGLHASVQAHATLPAIYVNLDQEQNSNSSASLQETEPSQSGPQQSGPQQPEQPWDRYQIVRVQEKNGKRIIGDIKISPLGKTRQEQSLVPTDSRRLSGGWVKVTPAAALEPGEYAVVEMLGKDGMNTYVWDFGVNPAAPANAGALQSQQPPAQPHPDKPKDLKVLH